MAISGLGALSSFGSQQYDFTNMTNAQLKNAAETLGSEGKISASEEQEMVGEANGMFEYTPGSTETAEQYLNDSTQHNFLSYFSGALSTAQTSGISAQTTDLLQNVVSVMEEYQANNSSDNPQGISTQA